MDEPMRAGELIELWAAKLPARTLGPDGEELLSSRLRRAVAAHIQQRAREAADPQARAQRLAREAEAEQKERERRSEELAHRYWGEMPQALGQMGLESQEITVLGAKEDRASVSMARAWWCKEATDPKRLFLTLGGVPRGGKTIAAASLLEPAATEYIRCQSVHGPIWNTALARFTKAQELARMSLYGKETEKRLERLRLVGLLVVDDLGAESKADAWWALLDELVDGRARLQLRTVFTTNLSGKDLEDRYGKRILGRLKQFGEFISVGGAG